MSDRRICVRDASTRSPVAHGAMGGAKPDAGVGAGSGAGANGVNTVRGMEGMKARAVVAGKKVLEA
ncbi:hypothetical protein DBA20_10635 [Pandoraea capi]|nr:hypothetical protein [Pandoraea sp. LA3]MDN4583441.1 hypothetical protein [Pandoraea capi]